MISFLESLILTQSLSQLQVWFPLFIILGVVYWIGLMPSSPQEQYLLELHTLIVSVLTRTIQIAVDEIHVCTRGDSSMLFHFKTSLFFFCAVLLIYKDIFFSPNLPLDTRSESQSFTHPNTTHTDTRSSLPGSVTFTGSSSCSNDFRGKRSFHVL